MLLAVSDVRADLNHCSRSKTADVVPSTNFVIGGLFFVLKGIAADQILSG